MPNFMKIFEIFMKIFNFRSLKNVKIEYFCESFVFCKRYVRKNRCFLIEICGFKGEGV